MEQGTEAFEQNVGLRTSRHGAGDSFVRLDCRSQGATPQARPSPSVAGGLLGRFRRRSGQESANAENRTVTVTCLL